jgi:hypothetical protein
MEFTGGRRERKVVMLSYFGIVSLALPTLLCREAAAMPGRRDAGDSSE